jgi:hypothetical protein
VSNEIATAGLTPDEARDRGLDDKTDLFPFRANGRALTPSRENGFIRVVTRAAEREGFSPPLAFDLAHFAEHVILVAMLNDRPQQSLPIQLSPPSTLNHPTDSVGRAL